MIQKYIFTLVILLCPPLLLHAMKFNKLGEIDTKLIKLYAKKVGTEKVFDQLKKCRPMRIIKPDPNDPRDIAHYEQFPCIHFKWFFTKEGHGRRGNLWADFVNDDILTAAIFTKIEEIESKDGHIPENEITESKNSVRIKMANNWLDRHTRYCYRFSTSELLFVESNTAFFHEDKEAIEEALN